MMKPIFASSDAATRAKPMRSVKYPWNLLEVGQSFAVPKAEIKFKTIYNYSSRMAKKLGFKFKVITHADVYEVARLADPDKPVPVKEVAAIWPKLDGDKV